MQKAKKIMIAKSLALFGNGVNRPMVQIAAMVGDQSVHAYHEEYVTRGLGIIRREWGEEVYRHA